LRNLFHIRCLFYLRLENGVSLALDVFQHFGARANSDEAILLQLTRPCLGATPSFFRLP
jgi:hypothetical protein